MTCVGVEVTKGEGLRDSVWVGEVGINVSVNGISLGGIVIVWVSLHPLL